MKEMRIFKKNEELQATVVDLTSQGAGVVKVDDFPFFVEGVIPGEEIIFNITKAGKKFGYGRLQKIIVESPDRVEITDPVGRQVGTMTLQHMNYPSQLAYKQSAVAQAFQRIGHFTNADVRPTLGMEHPWEYRNKAQIPVRTIRGQLETGFFRRNSHDLVPVENFYIQQPEIDKAIVTIRDILREEGVQPYDEQRKRGVMRHIVVKRGHYTGQMMIILVINQKRLEKQEFIVEKIKQQLPNVVSIVQNINNKDTNVILGGENKILWGRDFIEDKMLDMTFRISPNSFYQVNTPQAEVLYQTAIEAAGLTGKETVLDAYCGIGTLSLALAKHAKNLYAMEIVAEAIEMAEQNAELNSIENVIFEVGKAEEWLPRWNDLGVNFDVVVVDPPRKGLEENFVTAVIEQAPEKIVYVSCNPATCARDCELFSQAGYELQFVQPVDLFGQTPHVECVALLKKVN
ncbi:23S rRNA (uracil(1939)-C(5))-methyltransferase RlmD [Fundicoccus sp. Sow4_D5]|uniref:23S rRNA (uracil(1939)-C(5))-methyltransferase RlmD n=1 Tax=unclassified Fundicoccus TaxID=2761543 RepID=UPI003F90AB6E